jgi:hypothetical protein
MFFGTIVRLITHGFDIACYESDRREPYVIIWTPCAPPRHLLQCRQQSPSRCCQTSRFQALRRCQYQELFREPYPRLAWRCDDNWATARKPNSEDVPAAWELCCWRNWAQVADGFTLVNNGLVLGGDGQGVRGGSGVFLIASPATVASTLINTGTIRLYADDDNTSWILAWPRSIGEFPFEYIPLPSATVRPENCSVAARR